MLAAAEVLAGAGGSVYKKAHSQLWVGGLRSLPCGSFQKTARIFCPAKPKTVLNRESFILVSPRMSSPKERAKRNV